MQTGLTDTSDQNAQIKKAFIKSAKRVMLGVDSSKFDKISFVRFSDFDGINAVITDKEPSEAWKNFFRERNIDLYF